jgi:hypothetical protein
MTDAIEYVLHRYMSLRRGYEADEQLVVAARAELAALTRGVEWAKGVLPSGEWRCRVGEKFSFLYKRNTDSYIQYQHWAHCVEIWYTWPPMNREIRDAAEILFDAMQHDEALRKEYER